MFFLPLLAEFRGAPHQYNVIIPCHLCPSEWAKVSLQSFSLSLTINEVGHPFVCLKAICVHTIMHFFFSVGLLVSFCVKEINPLDMSCKSHPTPSSFLSFELLLCLLFQSRIFVRVWSNLSPFMALNFAYT